MKSVTQLFEDCLAAHPQRIAVRAENVSWTYTALDELASRLSGGLAAQGIGPGAYVPVLMRRSPIFLATVLAVLRRGAAYVPIDPGDPPERVQGILEDLGTAVLLVSRAWKGDIPGHATSVRVEDLTGCEQADSIHAAADDPAYIMYTSGSTGRPKGVVVPHRGIVRLVRDADYAEFGPERVWALLSSTAFDASTLEVWGPLLNGGCCAVLEDRLPTISRLGSFFRERQVTDAWLTAAWFNAIVDHDVDTLAPLRQLFTGGEIDSPPHFRKVLESCPQTTLIHGYGPTENTTFSLCHRATHADVSGDERVPIGRPIHGTEMIIEAPDGSEATGEQPGELLVGGLGVALGYLNQPELTAERFVHVDGHQGIWYRTGDLVRRRQDGAIVFVGRVDRQIKLRGFRIEPEEIEVVATGCPGIDSVVVEVIGDAADSRFLAAFYTSDDSTDPHEQTERVRAWLEARVPAHMVPTEILAVEEFPRTRNGKIDRPALHDLRPTARPAPFQEAPGDHVDAVLTICRTLLPGAVLEADSDFLGSGGHSILVLRLIAEVRRRLGHSLLPSVIYRERTPAGIARALATAPESVPTATSAVAERQSPAGSCASVQGGVLYESWLAPSSSAYHVMAAYLAAPGFDVGSFTSSLLAATRRHDALRSVFDVTSEGIVRRHLTQLSATQLVRHEAPIQWPGPPTPLPVLVQQTIREPFALARGPLVRAHLFPLPGDRTLLVLVFHHAIIDDWSLHLLLQQLEGAPVRRAPPFDDYVSWEQRHSNLALAASRGTEIFQAVRAGTLKPATFGRVARETEIRLSRDVTQRLDAIARAHGTTVFTVLLAAYAVAAGSIAGDQEPWVITPFANRGDPAIDDIVGCCLDLRFLRIKPLDAASFGELVSSVHAQVAAEHDQGPVPLATVAQTVRAQGGPPIQSLMHHVLTYRVGSRITRTLGGVSAAALPIPAEQPRYGLLVQFERDEDVLRCRIESSWTGRRLQELEQIGNTLTETITRLLSSPDAPLHQASGTGAVTRTVHPSLAWSGAEAPEGTAQICRRIWNQVLGVDAVDVSDDFFQSGGTSLMLIRLASTLKEATGMSLDLGQFVIEPTLGRLPRLLHEPLEESVVSYGNHEADTVLVSLPSNFGPAAASLALWDALRDTAADRVEYLGIDQTYLQDPSLDFPQAMDDLATMIGRRIGSRRFGIVGSSFGGIVAFEVAARLSENGQSPWRVWMLDSYAPDASFRDRVRNALAGVFVSLRSPAYAWSRVQRKLARRRASRRAHTESGSPRPGTAGTEECGESLPLDLVTVARAHLRGFEPRMVDVPMTVIRSSSAIRPLQSYFRPAHCGWGPLTHGEVTAHSLPLAHADFMVRSGAEAVAALMRRDLERMLSREREYS